MKITTFGDTNRGKVRSRNEDMFLVNDPHRIYAVADGLGGLPNGAFASRLAIGELEEVILHPDYRDDLDLVSLFNTINKKVHEEGRKLSEEIGIGTTLTVLDLNGKDISIGHVGDCVVFLFRNDSWKQITTDHTMTAELRSRLKPGEDAYIPEYFSHTLTRCIGQEGEIDVDEYCLKPQSGDRILICSDGITKTIKEDELLAEATNAPDPQSLIQKIIRRANDRGGPDNVTGVAIFFD